MTIASETPAEVIRAEIEEAMRAARAAEIERQVVERQNEEAAEARREREVADAKRTLAEVSVVLQEKMEKRIEAATRYCDTTEQEQVVRERFDAARRVARRLGLPTPSAVPLSVQASVTSSGKPARELIARFKRCVAVGL